MLSCVIAPMMSYRDGTSKWARRLYRVADAACRELDADWNKIGYESAPVDAKYNHPILACKLRGIRACVRIEQFIAMRERPRGLC